MDVQIENKNFKIDESQILYDHSVVFMIGVFPCLLALMCVHTACVFSLHVLLIIHKSAVYYI